LGRRQQSRVKLAGVACRVKAFALLHPPAAPRPPKPLSDDALPAPPTFNVVGDFDGDYDVDQTDFGSFQRCISGSGVIQSDSNCLQSRLDGDQDVDSNDFNVFSGCMSGADIKGNLKCAAP